MNHSCEPNVGLRGNVLFVAVRAIAAGDELTIDYAMIDDEDGEMACRCGTAGCSGTISGRDWRHPELQIRYGPYFSATCWRRCAEVRARRMSGGGFGPPGSRSSQGRDCARDSPFSVIDNPQPRCQYAAHPARWFRSVSVGHAMQGGAMKARPLWFALPLMLALLFVAQPGGGATPTRASGYDQLKPIQKRLLSGFAALALNPPHAVQANAVLRNFFPHGDDGCPVHLRGDIKVNQNCVNLSDTDLQGRGQANNETAVAQDPLRPGHLVASYNDYRRGDGNCYSAYSLDRGQSWTDSTPPMGFTRGTAFGAAREYWEAGGDTAVAWDTRGNAYLQCQMFQRGSPTTPNADLSSAVYVFRSTGNDGASWNFPARPVVENNDTGATGVLFEDKPYMTVDNSENSPFRDRVYVTWTEFAADGSAYIWESFSNDYGEHFSARHLVSKTSPLCVITFGLGTPQGPCNENQDSQPFTGADGALYVLFSNFNNAVSGSDNRNQILLVKSTDGGATFSAPVKVADFYDLPDCATYQGGADPGRACVPEKAATANSIFRATNYGSGAVDPTDNSHVVVAFGSYINTHSNEANGCTPAGFSIFGTNTYTGVKTPGACNNDILVSVSTNAGASFSGTTQDPRVLISATPDRRQATTDQWWQWLAFTRDGRIAISYYDRQYGDDETTGFMDFSLSGSDDGTQFGTTRITAASMPPPTQFSGLFFGDYTGLSADQNAHPIWMDTRDEELFLCPGTGVPGVPPATCTASASNAATANDQDIFTNTVSVPSR